MLVPLAIAALAAAVVDDGNDRPSIEERFRLLYSLGDKDAAYRLLFTERSLLADLEPRVSDLRGELLRPLLMKIVDPLTTQQTLEGVGAVLEEIESVLVAWWHHCSEHNWRGQAIDLDKIASKLVGTRVDDEFQKIRWPAEREEPDQPAEIPIFANLTTLFDESLVQEGWAKIFRHNDKILSWDARRVLIQRPEWVGLLPILHFEIWTIDRLIASDLKIPDIGSTP